MTKEAAKCECLCGKCHCKISKEQEKRSMIDDKIDDSKDTYQSRLRVLRNKLFARQCKLNRKECNMCKDAVDPHNLKFYEFDHIDPDTKINNVSNLVRTGRSIKSLREEIEKCVLLCRYCHAKRTAIQQKEIREEVAATVIKPPKKYRKLTGDMVKAMRAEYAKNPNKKYKELGKKYNVDGTRARSVILNNSHYDSTYKHPHSSDIIPRRAVLTYETVAKIRDEYSKDTNNYNMLSKKYGTDRSSIRNIILNKSHHDPDYEPPRTD
jgi:Mor family transcriptional regulator